MERCIKIFSFLFFLTFFSFIVYAQTVENPSVNVPSRHLVFEGLPLNLEEIVRPADRIFEGVCEKIEKIEGSGENKIASYKYTFKVTDSIKGVKKNTRITFNHWEFALKSGGYQVGKKYFLFLFPDSQLGVTSPVGFAQGKFEVKEEGFWPFNKKSVVNGKSNRGLARNLRSNKEVVIEKNQALTKRLSEASEKGLSIVYNDLVQSVKYLEEKIKKEEKENNVFE